MLLKSFYFNRLSKKLDIYAIIPHKLEDTYFKGPYVKKQVSLIINEPLSSRKLLVTDKTPDICV